MTDRKVEFLTLLERYALTVARREGAVDYQELRATEALADELRAELLAFIQKGEKTMRTNDQMLTTRMTQDELKILTKQAKAAGCTRSEYVRAVIRALQEKQELQREFIKFIQRG